MNQVQVERKSYQMPPREGFTVAHFLTVADIDRSTRFYEKVFGGRILRRGDSERLRTFRSRIRGSFSTSGVGRLPTSRR
jgi:predicted enzyme related to lactoylglutathione lyase